MHEWVVFGIAFVVLAVIGGLYERFLPFGMVAVICWFLSLMFGDGGRNTLIIWGSGAAIWLGLAVMLAYVRQDAAERQKILDKYKAKRKAMLNLQTMNRRPTRYMTSMAIRLLSTGNISRS